MIKVMFATKERFIMREIIDYKIVFADSQYTAVSSSVSDLQEKVKDLISQGWQPIPSFYDGVGQVLVRYSEQEEK